MSGVEERCVSFWLGLSLALADQVVWAGKTVVGGGVGQWRVGIGAGGDDWGVSVGSDGSWGGDGGDGSWGSDGGNGSWGSDGGNGSWGGVAITEVVGVGSSGGVEESVSISLGFWLSIALANQVVSVSTIGTIAGITAIGTVDGWVAVSITVAVRGNWTVG